MKLNQIMIAAAMSIGLTSGAYAAEAGHGKITFTGSIIDAPCSVSPDSVDQTVDLGQVSSAALSADGNTGTSTPRNFEINLENCTLVPGQESVTTTFTGAEGLDGKLGITGNATGVGIVLTDGASNKIELGQASAPQTLKDGSNTLLFSAYLQGDGASANISAGDFSGVADFMLQYQ
ncbi:TPA: fimbrial protein [Citrobacter koseri]